MSEIFRPFAEDTAALMIGGITIENGTDRVSLSGSLDFTLDGQALDHAKALRAALDAIIGVLESNELPSENASPSTRPMTTKEPNPFA